MMHLYFVKIEPGSTNMRTRAGEKVGGVLTPGPHRDWRHCSKPISWLIRNTQPSQPIAWIILRELHIT